MGLRDEILEQPAAAERLLDSAPAAFAPISAAIRSRRPRFAVIAARGTSDNAGIYAQYLLGIRNGLVVALAAPSTITLYGARPNMADALVVAISQSGRSPDIVAVVDEARRQGALTVVLTNDTDSPLAETADHVVDLRAGPELATAATKTYTTELLAAALLSAALDPPSASEAVDLAGLPALMTAALTTEPQRARSGRRARRTRACRRPRPRLLLRDRARVGAQAAGDGAGAGHALFDGRLRARADGAGRAWLSRPGGRPERPRARRADRPARAPEGGPRRAPAGHLGRAGSARDRRGAGPAGRHPALAGADRRHPARPAVRLSPDRRARPRPRASAHDQQGHRDALAGDEPLIPARAVLRRAALAGEVDVDQAEPPGVAKAPLVVVEKRPDVVAGQRHSRAKRVGGRGDVACQVVQPAHVAHPAVLIDGIGVGGAVLGDHDLAWCVRLVELEQDVAQTVGRDVPAHLRLLRVRHGADLPVECAVRPGADGVAPVVVQAQVIEIAGRRLGEVDAVEVTRLAVSLESQRRVATAEERIEEPRVASGAPLVGSDSIPLRIGRRRDLIDVDRHADLRVVDQGADRLGGAGVGAQFVVGHPDRRRPVTQPRRMDAVGMAEEGEDGRLVERHPILDTVAQVRREQRGVVGEPAHDLRVGEAAAVLQRLRQVPVEQVDQRLDARAEQGVDEALIEVEAGLVDGASPRGQDARPADAEAICARPQIGHQPDVLWVAVVVVAGDVARAAVGDGARLAGEGVPDRRSSAVLGRRSLDLVGGGGEAPGEVSREGLGEPGWVGLERGRHAHRPIVSGRARYDPMMSQLRVLVEQPTRGKRWVAVAADWPGLERGGKTEDEAVEKLAHYVPRYLPVAKRVRLGSELATQTDLDIIGRYPGVGSTDFWGISFAPSPLDREPFDAPTFDRQVRLLRAAWAEFDETAVRVSAELRPGVRGGGRSRDRIIQHVLGQEGGDFSRRVNAPAEGDLQTPGELAEHRDRFVEAMRAWYAEGKPLGNWTIPYSAPPHGIPRARPHLGDAGPGPDRRLRRRMTATARPVDSRRPGHALYRSPRCLQRSSGEGPFMSRRRFAVMRTQEIKQIEATHAR